MASDLIESLRWKKFPVLNDGFVALVDVMGDDSSIVDAARVSFGAATKKVSSDADLIRFLMRHQHGTPFEMAEVKLLVRVPMDCWRQWIRHWTASVNEYSTRYSEAIDSAQRTSPDEWRVQATANKQGSGDNVEITRGQMLSAIEADFQTEARKVYEQRISLGVAREQARKDLPLSTYTEAYWKCDLRNIFHFLSLRMDSHAQLEIRQYADAIGRQIIAPLFPVAWQAFVDYDLESLRLSRLDVLAIRQGLGVFSNNREAEECRAKLVRMGLFPS